jgi:ubiquinone/menaquinone biosynthesis C-methylase UbiE
MDLDEYRRHSQENWDRFAGNWRDERQFMWEGTRPVSERMVERLDPQPGDTVLELACGTGDTGFLAARRIGDDGKLIQTDFAEQMVDVARGFAAEAGLGNIEHRQLDAESMDIPDESVDGVMARYGYMLMADPAAALAETHRVLKPGGRLSFGVWTTPERNLWAFLPAFALVESGHLDPPEPGAPGIFAMGDPDRIEELVTGAGFDSPQVEEVQVAWGYHDPDVHWEKTMKLAAPIADALESVPEGEREAIRQRVAERVAEKIAEDPDALDGSSWVVSVAK